MEDDREHHPVPASFDPHAAAALRQGVRAGFDAGFTEGLAPAPAPRARVAG
ncbi:MAG TPA: hypothetical protein VGB24_02465 [Longimicrobium sp.]|uniref:hypothetical protein n=1 Tax=Longimicrobium sp. TaxID=2029185 RepID=UPI002ED8F30E